MQHSPNGIRWWAWAGLLAVLLFDVWLRGHTIGPTIHDRLGFDLYPVTGRASEPLDCDEAVYAYIGKRIVHGDVLYRDLTENKPPLGYWLYALAVGLGGFNELTIRLMPIPFVLATIAIVWWIARKLGGEMAGLIAAFTSAVVTTDPYLFGNGANMEHMIDLCSIAALGCTLLGWDRRERWPWVAAGACVGAAFLVKQVAALNGLVFGLALLLRRPAVRDDEPVRPRMACVGDLIALVLGAFGVVCLAATVLVLQGAGRDAFEDIVRYGRALATETPPPPNAPLRLVRWFTGNADPEGVLPWPFGRTNYLVWWGTGSWPLWLAAIPATFALLLGKRRSAGERLVAAWTLSAWVQVALPGLFWQHYYLLPTPGIAVVVPVFLVGELSRRRAGGLGGALVHGVLGVLALTALLATYGMQAREYLAVAPEELTIRDKGGRQWVVLRDLGRELGRRAVVWEDPHLFVWGWQSPLYFYSGLDGVTRQLFADDFIRNHAETRHPLVVPRIERTMRDLRANPPALIFNGYPPFPELRAFLAERYLPSSLVGSSSDGRGLWVERSRYGEFETARAR